jgi:hypothetical protein
VVHEVNVTRRHVLQAPFDATIIKPTTMFILNSITSSQQPRGLFQYAWGALLMLPQGEVCAMAMPLVVAAERHTNIDLETSPELDYL